MSNTRAGVPADAAPLAAYVEQLRKKIAVRRLREDELAHAIALLRARVPAAAASDETIRAIHRRNADSIWGIYRDSDVSRPGAEILGFYCLLILNAQGVAQLRREVLDTANPDARCLADAGERPAGIYFWAIVAEGLTIAAGPRIFLALGPDYCDVPLFVRPTTEAGLKRVRKSSYVPLVEGRDGMGHIFTMPRYPELDRLKALIEAAPAKRKLGPRIEVKVAATPAEMEMALRIRAVYLIEQSCPYDEEYDGNDYCGTTFLGFVNGEPAGTLRVRYFGGFVKFERMTVLPRFRRTTTVAREIVRTAVAFCARKGFRKGYGHAQLHAMKFWSRFGFRAVPTNRALVFSDHRYIEIEGEFPAHEDPITLTTDPYVIVRPEGQWDEPGVLDRSAARPATNPH